MTTLEQAEALARGAGELLSRHYGRLRRADASRKEGVRRDLVSAADLDAERSIVAGIPAADDILGEEGARRDRGADRCWVVDPLDGTVNFLHGIPYWCVSIGVVEGGALAGGVVHAPELGETFTVEAGGGARLNGEPIRVSPTADLRDAMLATGLAYRRNELPDHNLDNIQTLAMACADLRRLGAAALDLAWVACGRLDGFWELHLNPWDVAAGILLVREAGGEVTDFRGARGVHALLHGGHLLASNGRIHEAIRGRLAPLRGLP